MSRSGGYPGFRLVAATALAGFALENGTPTILSWTAPSDGSNHRFIAILAESVTSAETGGQVESGWTQPSGNTATANIFSAGQAVGEYSSDFGRMVKSGTTVTIYQNNALTAGAAAVWAEIWAS